MVPHLAAISVWSHCSALMLRKNGSLSPAPRHRLKRVQTPLGQMIQKEPFQWSLSI